MKIGLALSGGGIRGIAHAGVLRAFEENNIKVDIIAGTSSGSMVAGLYAMGYSPHDIYILFKRYAKTLVKLSTGAVTAGIGGFLINKKINIRGLKTGKDIEDMYNTLASTKKIKKISDITMPLVIPVVDISNSKEYIFASKMPEKGSDERYITDISIGKAIRSSSSFPVVFSPCKYEEHLFLDGGILDNIPALETRNFGADKVISIKFDSDPVDKESNVMDIVMKIVDIMGSKIGEESLASSDYVITIPSDGTGLLEADKIDFCYQSGYDTTMKCINKIKKSLEK